jgi:uncharacterized membrane protein YczE
MRRSPPASFVPRFLQLNLGLLVFGFAISLMIRANIGLDPWSVLHEGLSQVTGFSFGQVTQLVGLGLIVLNFALLGLKPGLGSALNMLLIGIWVDFFGRQSWLPSVPSGAWAEGVLVFILGILLCGLAIGLYISPRFGAGPRDDFVLGWALKLQRSVRLVRGLLELTVLTLGFVLGGSVGLGTVLFALLIGPVMQFFLRLFRYTAPTPVVSASD